MSLEQKANAWAAIGVKPAEANALNEPGRVREAFKAGHRSRDEEVAAKDAEIADLKSRLGIKAPDWMDEYKPENFVQVDDLPLPVPKNKDEVNFGKVKNELDTTYIWEYITQRWLRYLPLNTCPHCGRR